MHKRYTDSNKVAINITFYTVAVVYFNVFEYVSKMLIILKDPIGWDVFSVHSFCGQIKDFSINMLTPFLANI